MMRRVKLIFFDGYGNYMELITSKRKDQYRKEWRFQNQIRGIMILVLVIASILGSNLAAIQALK